jgi:glutaredoxin
MSSIRVVMYTRRGCHLCDEAWRMLQELRVRFDLELESVDTDGNAELVRLHGERVPVIAVNGKECCWGRINRVLLERQLQNEPRNTRNTRKKDKKRE